MKRILAAAIVLILIAGNALAAGYNSFMDDPGNAGRFDNVAWDGEYVYWLHTPDDGSWADPPANLYRMVPGEGEAEMLLQGREDLYIYSMLNIGGRLLLSVADEGGGGTHPVLLNFDGGSFEALPGNIGSVVVGEGVLYNSADGAVYEIPLDTMKPKVIYKYAKAVLRDNPVLCQYADGKLYFVTDTHDWYELDLERKKARQFLSIRGSGFVWDGMFYVSDFDALDGSWKYDISSGSRVKISDAIYDFLQGSGSFVRATGDDADSWFQGCVFDFAKLEGDLEAAHIAECGEYRDYIINGRILHHDWENNRMEWGAELP